MRVIVFGGAGFIGQHTVMELAKAGHEVTVFDRKEPACTLPFVRYIIGDILEYSQVFDAVSGQEIVYNFAALADLNEGKDCPLETIQINILGNAYLMEASVKCGVKRFFYASTIYVYSQKGGFYRCSKQSSEIYLEEYNKRYSLNYTVLRYGTLYGPGADSHNSIYRYLYQGLLKRSIQCANPNANREYIHVRDAAKLSVEALDEKYINKHIILTGHYSMKVIDMLNIIKEIIGSDVKLLLDEAGEDVGHYVFTPYSFSPQLGQKLISNEYTDIGQGLIECLEEIYYKEHLNDKSNGV